ncbi:hypothetical protein PTSG_01786 [Salpingoeca rosetta]|uniref:Uncharacterized protein n=1 Tax=Salpingoeca rosetta (strain ATCC 50818 / BSB-021) TaxID=946362 RepID=F2TYY7_SALR5|nr:uncharacterized protein PTSG_01786 [Salpingoeca rosetta]EGD78811.1 hypothetical protein PTSG_01786 [Salpingoeca rosetta]|eukprot:XP_004997767.1 hypothetical protein PTSG_01786 [Salpingoeca rosetta]
MGRSGKLMALVAGVFGMYLCYSFVQELLFRQGFKPFGFYITLIQFVYYIPLSAIDLKLRNIKISRTSWSTYAGLAFLTVVTMSCSNAALSYVSLPVQIIFKSCKLIPVMVGGILIQRKRYGVMDYFASLLLCCGLVVFATADMSLQVSYHFAGIVLLCVALCADAVIGNVQEKVMKANSVTPTEMVFFSYSIGTVYLLILTLSTGEFVAGFNAFLHV